MNRSDNRQKGMSLTELLMATAILGVVVGTASTYFVKVNTATRIETVKGLQANLARRIELALANPDSIRNAIDFGALPGNAVLANCVAKGVPCGGAATNSAVGVEFDLFDSTGPVPQKIAGPLVGYSTDGGLCSIGAPKCIFEAATKFWATCDLDGSLKPKATCTEPKMLNFKYQIRAVRQLGLGANARLKNYPPDELYNGPDVTTAIRTRTTDVMLRIGETCGVNQKLVKIEDSGKVVCDCISNTIDYDKKGNVSPVVDKLGRPVCGDQACSSKYEIMVGYKAVSVKGEEILVPDCINPKKCSDEKETRCPCRTVDLGVDGDCGPGFWMVSIHYGECEATTEKGKAAPETIKCSEKKGRCCKLDIQ